MPDRMTMRSPASSTTFVMSRRSEASPRRTSITRTASRLNIFTSLTFCPTMPLSSGIATSVKYFICERSVRNAAIELRSGSSRQPTSARNAPPARVTAMPTGAMSKMPNGSIPLARTTPSTSRLVEVPIRVIMPPMTVKKLSGINSFEAGILAFLATWMTIGIITATTGVLFMIADAMQTKVNSSAMVSKGRVSARAATMRDRWSSAPVRSRPPMMMNMKAMVQGALFDSWLTASL